jgi:hypothetical protein
MIAMPENDTKTAPGCGDSSLHLTIASGVSGFLTNEQSATGPPQSKHKQSMAGARKIPDPALADLIDDAVVPEGATDEVSHCLGSCGAIVSQL